jgi:hypothetical protein
MLQLRPHLVFNYDNCDIKTNTHKNTGAYVSAEHFWCKTNGRLLFESEKKSERVFSIYIPKRTKRINLIIVCLESLICHYYQALCTYVLRLTSKLATVKMSTTKNCRYQKTDKTPDGPQQVLGDNQVVICM